MLCKLKFYKEYIINEKHDEKEYNGTCACGDVARKCGFCQ